MLGGQGIAFAIRIAGFVVLGRLLEPSDFGLVAMAATALVVAELIRDAGLSVAGIQASELTDEQHSSLLWANLAIGTSTAGICAGAAPFVASAYGDPRIERLVQAMAVVFVVNGLATQYGVRLIRVDAYKSVVKVALISQLLGLAIAVVAFAAGAGYWSLVVQTIVVSVSTLAFYAGITRWVPQLRFRLKSIRPFIGFGSRLLAVQALSYVAKTVDRAGLGYAHGSREVGLYTRSYQLALMAPEAISVPILPLAVRYLVSGGVDPKRVRVTQTLSAWAVMVPVAFVAATAAPLVEVLLGNEWRAAGPILTILTVVGAVQAVGFAYNWIFLALARTDVFLRCTLISLPLSTGIILMAVPLGARWVAAAVAVGTFVQWLIVATWGMRQVGQPVGPLLAGCLRPATAGLAIAIAGQMGILAVGDEIAIVRLLAGTLAGAAGGALVAAAVPGVRRDVRLVIETIGTIVRGRPLEDVQQ